MEDVLLAFGNPLLDISASVPSSLLEKYELKSGNAILADPQKHLPLYDELVKNHKVQYIAGGATQNSVRAAQWMLQSPKATHFIGCIGNDEFGKTLKSAAEKDGVQTHYLVDDKAATGTCAVLIENKERSLVANLSAANEYKKDKHYDTKEIQDLVQKVKFYYSASFFLTVSPETLIEVGKHAVANDKRFLTNLSAPFLVDFFWDGKMSEVLKYADVVFGNEDEAATLGKKLDWGTDLQEVAKKLADYPKINTKVKRTVVFTQGAKQTIVCIDGKIQTFEPIPCKPEEIVDTNGAGDSFVGGFLSGYVQGKSIEDCVKAGHYCALSCIKVDGCAFFGKPEFKF